MSAQHTPTAELQRMPPRQCDTCSDHDEECVDVVDKVHCWLYDPGRGMCPFLRDAAIATTKQEPRS